MRSRRRLALLLLLAASCALAAGVVTARFRADLGRAVANSERHSQVVDTDCGPVEYQSAGEGRPLLVVHGSGGGHDQGMAFARPLLARGIRVIAPSRFGYLRTPMPEDGSPQAQADAHACLLDALGVQRAAVLGISAGGASALQMAIRHPHRLDALLLVVPIAWKPGDIADSAPPASPAADRLLLGLLGSDLLYWTMLQVARDAVFRHVLATPPELIAAATSAERARVHAMADAVLPVSRRAAGLRADTTLGRSLGPAALASVGTPTLLISARDDGFGTWAAAEYTAGEIPGARFTSYERGGHLLVGHGDAVLASIADWVHAPAANQSTTRDVATVGATGAGHPVVSCSLSRNWNHASSRNMACPTSNDSSSSPPSPRLRPRCMR
jgi:pimeloyl-ACP methyl ester carboxylesterase